MLSTIIFIITRGGHNRPGVAAVPIVSQSKKKKKKTKKKTKDLGSQKMNSIEQGPFLGSQ
jgi:hypothetical protein